LINGRVLILALDDFGQDTKLKNLVVALFLDQYKDYMSSFTQDEVQDELRVINSLLIIDEALNILPYKFPTLEAILREGRSFGVGTALSTQLVRDFDQGRGADAVPFDQLLRSWVIHRVPQVTPNDLEGRGIAQPNEETCNRIRALNRHEAYYSSLHFPGRFIRGKAFFELVQEKNT